MMMMINTSENVLENIEQRLKKKRKRKFQCCFHHFGIIFSFFLSFQLQLAIFYDVDVILYHIITLYSQIDK